MRSNVIALGIALGAALAADSRASNDLPVSRGEYQIRLGGERIGEEQFRVFQDGKKRYRIEVTRMLYWPEPTRHEIRYELEASLEPKKLSLLATRGGIQTELKLDRKGESWQVEVKGQGRDRKKHALGRRAGTVVDFDSPIFNALALRELKLAPGQAKTLEAVVLALPDLVGVRARQTYRRLEDEEIETEASGKVLAAVYEMETGAATHRFRVSPSGIVLEARFEKAGGEQEVLLMRWQGGSGPWP